MADQERAHEACRGHQPDGATRALEALRHHRVGEHRGDRACGEGLHCRDRRRRRSGMLDRKTATTTATPDAAAVEQRETPMAADSGMPSNIAPSAIAPAAPAACRSAYGSVRHGDRGPSPPHRTRATRRPCRARPAPHRRSRTPPPPARTPRRRSARRRRTPSPSRSPAGTPAAPTRAPRRPAAPGRRPTPRTPLRARPWLLPGATAQPLGVVAPRNERHFRSNLLTERAARAVRGADQGAGSAVAPATAVGPRPSEVSCTWSATNGVAGKSPSRWNMPEPDQTTQRDAEQQEMPGGRSSRGPEYGTGASR